MKYIIAVPMIPTLLRLLLAASLVLNGLALPLSAHATDLHQVQGAIEQQDDHKSSSSESGQDPPCHGEAAAIVDSGKSATLESPGQQDSHAGQGSSGCCESGSCDGVCMQAASAVLSARAFEGDSRRADCAACSIPAGTLAPAQPQPIRPPIA